MPEPKSPDQIRIDTSAHLRKMPGFIQARPIYKNVKPHVQNALENVPTENREDMQKLRRITFQSAAGVYNESKNLIEEARIDPLTGAFSRGEIRRRLVEEAARIKRNGNKSSIAFLDVNDLKVVNDRKEGGGHDAGDELLVNTVIVLQTCGRETDLIGRYGGDEFVVILPGSDIDGAKIYWDRANQEFTKKDIKISCGLTEIDPDDIDFSIAKADEAMYKAKAASKIAGVNTVVIHQEPKP